MLGNYKLHGKLFLLEWNGAGPANITRGTLQSINIILPYNPKLNYNHFQL